MLQTGSPLIDAERAFSQASRARLLGNLTAWVRRRAASRRLRVFPATSVDAVRDGHHRVSVARARGASTIDAVVE